MLIASYVSVVRLDTNLPSTPTQARVQAHRFVLALRERAPKAMDHHSWGCLRVEKFPTFASGRQRRGPATLLSSRRQFPRARLRDVPQEESPAYGDGSVRLTH